MKQRTGPRARAQSGFTLIEIMVVVVILGILAAFAVPNIMSNPERARITQAESDIRTLESQLEMYRLDNHRYPTTDQGLDALVERPRSQPEPPNWQEGGYMRSVPTDPWGNPYEYLDPEDADGRVMIYTYGPDGRQGGDPEITNRDLD
ncbi:type II secretion system major pseudopilin GspG [Aquisalimonas sp.]|uniref:type II secretion system major pseudopilin GspG n=1 Tax=unclassified Aquisalimonas TaxID=2644645 RepID=UPI0025BD07D1|nr:type II secretion system major pseudopilin GspG [Aquisalimonas sp.]